MEVMVSYHRMLPIGSKAKNIIVNNKRLRNDMLCMLACVVFSHGWKLGNARVWLTFKNKK